MTASVIDETLREAWLSDELGVDVIWLAEHHFDGICAYVDPISFAGALATSTRRSKIGFAVVQTALHHPIRLAEQLAILDNITKGRLVVGLGRGSSYNIYDYQGFGIDHHEAQDRLEEAEQILVTAWTGEGFSHHGKFWRSRCPDAAAAALYKAPSGAHPRRFGRSLDARTRPPGPAVPDECAVDGSDEPARRSIPRGDARGGLRRGSGSRAPLRSAGCGGTCSSPRPTPKPSASGVPVFQAMVEARAALRNRIFRETGMRIAVPESDLPSARATVEHGFIHGSPARVAEAMADIDQLGIGGVIASFRLGPMPHETATNSLRLFMEQVAPEIRRDNSEPRRT